jgi:hypothetical protein
METPALLYGSECCILTEKQKGRSQTTELRFLSVTSRYRLMDRRRNEDISLELQIVDINSRTEYSQMKWLQHLERMQQRSPKLLSDYKPRGHVICGENNYEFNS